MKYKGKQGNSYLFECEGEVCSIDGPIGVFVYGNIHITKNFNIWCFGIMEYKDIQTAVKMMQILIEEGEV